MSVSPRPGFICNTGPCIQKPVIVTDEMRRAADEKDRLTVLAMEADIEAFVKEPATGSSKAA